MPCRSSRAWRPTRPLPWTRSIASPAVSRRARGKPTSIRCGARNGRRWRTASPPSPTARRPKDARSPPATITCARATTTTAPSASSRPARRRWRCITRRCAHITLPWSASIPRSSASRCRYEDTSLPAYFVAGAGSGRRPTVGLFDGMDNAKEMSVIFAGLDFAKRGINTLAIDGPGQAEALRLRNIHSRHDYEVAGTAAYDYVASRAEVDPKRRGYSFGRLSRAAHCCLREANAAAVAFGAIYDWVAGQARSRPAPKLHLDLPT